MQYWTLANGMMTETITLDGASVTIETTKAGKTKATTKVLASAEAAEAFARKQIDARVREECIYDARTQTYDFSEMRALLGIVLHTLVPAAAPYDEAIATFEKETAEIVRRLHWNEERGPDHARALFANLLEYIDARAPVPGLTDGVKRVFAAHAR